MKPIVVVNFKTYKQGLNAVKLAKAIEKVGKDVIIGVQASDVLEITKATKLKVFSQHVDYFSPGRHTGYIIPEAVKKDRVAGTFLNHSEHKLSYEILKKTIERCKKIRLKTFVFAGNLKEAEKIQKLKPDCIIIEPPELVAGKKSVSKAKPELIKKIKEKIKMKFLVGAGIHTKEDVEIAMKLGAAGIAVSSAITKARNPAKKLKQLINY
jgi:triosephosphate isomerase